jgi:prophage tail gpP-like protein
VSDVSLVLVGRKQDGTPNPEAGKEFIGWTQVEVSRAITQACSAFSLSLNDSDQFRVSLEPGQDVLVKYKGQTILTGIIDAVEITYDSTSHDIAISGRSRTKDVIDSWTQPVQFDDQSVLGVCQAIAGEFGIQVKLQADQPPEKIQDFQIDAREGKTFDALQDAVGLAGWYLSDDFDGNLIITRLSDIQTTNEIINIPGQYCNVLGASLRNDESNRYNTYRVIGQNAPTDDSFGLDAAQILGEVTDRNIGRNRLKIITGETGLTTVQAQTRAIQERQAAIAESFGIEYVMQGWAGSGGELWLENRLVNVRDDMLGVQRVMLIDTVNYILDNQGGTTCRLSLVLPEARTQGESDTRNVMRTSNSDMGYPQ